MQDQEKIANLSKYCGTEPSIVFKNVFAIVADSQKRQHVCAKQIMEFLDSTPEIKLVVIHRLTRYFDDSTDKKAAANKLKSVVGELSRLCVEKGIALVSTADVPKNNSSRLGKIPRPHGGLFLRHLANVIVYFRALSGGNSTSNLPSYKIFLVKHGYMKSYKSALIYPVHQIGKFHGLNGGGSGILVFS
jgi:hypothetical protein